MVARFLAACGVAACFSFAVGQAHASAYECDFPINAAHRGWVASRVVMVFDSKAGTGQVIDDLVNYQYGKPIDLTSLKVAEDRVDAVWNVNSKGSTAVRVNVRSSLQIDRATNKAHLDVLIRGYGQIFSSRGTCKYFPENDSFSE